VTSPAVDLALAERYAGPRYAIVAWARGQDRLFYEEFGSYQGEWLLLARAPATGNYYLYKGSYGSCSGCDSYEAAFSGSPAMSEAQKFAADYLPFAEIPQQTMRNLAERGTLKRILPLNERYSANDNEGDSVDRVAGEMIVAVKVTEGLEVTVADIMAAQNAEIKQLAIRAYGYEKFVEDAHAEEFDREGADALLRINGPNRGARNPDVLVFLSVKDSSTDRRYLLRVPPHMSTVRQAKAWTFGLNQPEDYAPAVET
jgi:type IV secretory pathway protease TraF